MKINPNLVSLTVSAGRRDQFPRDMLPRIALSGRSNVGKSSLINTLLGRKSLARVSCAPGKTVTVNFYNVDNKLYLVDLPGYGFAKRSQGKQASFCRVSEDFFTDNPAASALRLVFQLIDLRTGASADDILMIRFLTENKIPFRVVATKADKLSPTARAAALDALICDTFAGTGITPLLFSAVSGIGKEPLCALMERVASGARID